MANMTIQSIMSAAKQRIDDFFPQQSDTAVIGAAAAPPPVSQAYIEMMSQFRLRTDLTPIQTEQCAALFNKHQKLEARGPNVILPGFSTVFLGIITTAIFDKGYTDDDTIKTVGLAAGMLAVFGGAAHALFYLTADYRLLNEYKEKCLEKDPNAKLVEPRKHATEPVRDPNRNPWAWLPWLLSEGTPQVSAQYRNYWRHVDPGHIESSPVGNALLALPLGVLGLARMGITAGAKAVEQPIQYAVEKMMYGAMELAF